MRRVLAAVLLLSLGGGHALGYTLVTTFTAPTGSYIDWTVPADWNDADNEIDCTGAGGVGAYIVGIPSGGGGGGGQYARSNNVSLTPGATAQVLLYPFGSDSTGIDEASFVCSDITPCHWNTSNLVAYAEAGQSAVPNSATAGLGAGQTGAPCATCGVGTTTLLPGANGTPGSTASGFPSGGAGGAGAGPYGGAGGPGGVGAPTSCGPGGAGGSYGGGGGGAGACGGQGGPSNFGPNGGGVCHISYTPTGPGGPMLIQGN